MKRIILVFPVVVALAAMACSSDKGSPACLQDADCDDGNPCSVDLCSDGACAFEPASGASCDDGNACTRDDQCLDGVCSGQQIACDDGNPCTDDGCDTQAGCVFEQNTATCDDGNPCTEPDICKNGACKGGPNTCQCQQDADCAPYEDGDLCNGLLHCSGGYCVIDANSIVKCDPSSDTACRHNTCDSASGLCGPVDMPDGTACDDADSCTSDDACSAGECTGVQLTCDDSDACTADACDAATGCTHEAISCDDTDACTTDACDAATGCTHEAISCDDSDACTTDTCDAATGCTHAAISCDDSDACTTDACDAATGCTHEAIPCDDSDACTADACDAATGCTHAPISCDDSDACTTDSCDAIAGCGHAPISCDDSDACTADSCDAVTGCTHAPISCDDSDACTADSCDAVAGCGHAPISCDDSDVCTTDSCDAVTGCTHAPVSCDDSDVCTTDGCDSLTGCTHVAISCDDSDACTADSCDAVTGCTHAPVSCDDSDVCTTDGCDSLTGCTHVAISCDDSDACTADTCDAATGCTHAPVSCDDGNICTDDSCDVNLGCLFADNTAACDDGDACTSPDTCSGGMCLPGPDICGGTVTVMVYMSADNNLDPFGLDDWQEMESANVDDAAWLRVFLLIDREQFSAWSDTRLYEVHNGTSTELDGPHLGITAGGSDNELNMGDPATLSNFIMDVKDTVGGGSYYVILWDHGDGWRSGMADDPGFVPKMVCDDETSGDWLYTQEIGTAVAGQGLSLIGIDACNEGMVEIAYELRNDAQVMVASEEMEPGDGWNYQDLLAQFKTEAGPNPRLFGQLAVDTFMDSAPYADMTLASYDLTKMNSLVAACDSMATALDGWSNLAFRQLCNDNSLEWFGILWGFDPYLSDLIQLATVAKTRDPANAAAYDAVITATGQVVLYERHDSDHPDATGISIYFKCKNGADPEYSSANLRWAADTIWDEMLHAR